VSASICGSHSGEAVKNFGNQKKRAVAERETLVAHALLTEAKMERMNNIKGHVKSGIAKAAGNHPAFLKKKNKRTAKTTTQKVIIPVFEPQETLKENSFFIII